MTTVNTDETLRHALETQGRRFARAWSQVGAEITGTLPLAGQAALVRLRQGDCLRTEVEEGLQVIGQRILGTHDRLMAEREDGYRGAATRQEHKVLVEVLMMTFLAFMGLRQKALGQGLGAPSCDR